MSATSQLLGWAAFMIITLAIAVGLDLWARRSPFMNDIPSSLDHLDGIRHPEYPPALRVNRCIVGCGKHRASSWRGLRGMPEPQEYSMKRILIPASYLSGIVAANVLTERFGLVPVGFGLVTTAGTYAAAWVVVSRNFAQDVIGRVGVIALMVVGALLSWWLASPALALASLTAFALSETADMLIYTPLRERGRSRAVAVASTVGGVIDTFVFLSIAGFPIAIAAPGQLVVKVGMALLAALALRGFRALHGKSVQRGAQPEGGAGNA